MKASLLPQNENVLEARGLRGKITTMVPTSKPSWTGILSLWAAAGAGLGCLVPPFKAQLSRLPQTLEVTSANDEVLACHSLVW